MSDNHKHIEILLSTHNGSSYLSALIESVISQQTDLPFQLTIADDFSTDSSVKCIKNYALQYPKKIKVVAPNATRLGAKESFTRLLTMSTGQYIMFCDQDDVWLPGKIKNTYKKMLWAEKHYGKEAPILIHTDLKVADSALNLISNSFWKYQNIHPRGRESLNRLLTQNVITGCTVMINNSLRQITLPIPRDAIMHDWWLALVSSAFGKIEHIDEATVLYRQHEKNEIGAKHWGDSSILFSSMMDKDRIKRSIMDSQVQAGAFLKLYSESLLLNHRKMLASYTSMLNHSKLCRVFSFFRYRLFKAGFLRNLGFICYL